MSGYLSFGATHPALDRLADAINEAGHAYHHTAEWQDVDWTLDDTPNKGKSRHQVIADAFAAADEEIDRLTRERDEARSVALFNEKHLHNQIEEFRRRARDKDAYAEKLKKALEHIAAYPFVRNEEMSPMAMRNVARAALAENPTERLVSLDPRAVGPGNAPIGAPECYHWQECSAGRPIEPEVRCATCPAHKTLGVCLSSPTIPGDDPQTAALDRVLPTEERAYAAQAKDAERWQMLLSCAFDPSFDALDPDHLTAVIDARIAEKKTLSQCKSSPEEPTL